MSNIKDDIFEKIKSERGGLASIHLAFSEFTQGVAAHYDFYKSIMLNEGLPLGRSDREFLAVETSRLNQCPYCVAHHAEALKHSGSEPAGGKLEILKALAHTMTLEPWKSSPLFTQFIAQGFSQAQWQHAVMVVSYFNFVNRCAHAMNLEIEPDFKDTCR
ncbi:MAG: hypothetical protein COT74_00595 [Bdellovibrionales bacterium CG10_big_fil_rev_8_21_14_0_10_45_34]|nr:MAG: hypothetical protein COT74_00595 [Bdellovibrionales bacterium CG10_big_fil_rev_8_21_14_0_10_45_34]